MFLPASANRLSGGFGVFELLEICRSFVVNKSSCEEPSSDPVGVKPAAFVTGPILFAGLAYLTVVVVIWVQQWTTIKLDGQETIPQQVLCFESLEKSVIELFPPRLMEMPQTEVLDLWYTVLDEGSPMKAENTKPNGKKGFFGVPGDRVDFFDPVMLPKDVWVKYNHKSLFSSQDWY
jgi:hypothetical protein